MATANVLIAPRQTPRKDPTPRLWSPDEFQKMCDLRIFAGYKLDLVGGAVVHRAAAGSSPRPFEFTQKEFCAIYDAGFFRDQRVQLIGGIILREGPMNTPHAVAVVLCQTVLHALFVNDCHVRVQLPITIGVKSEPHPDLAVVAGSARDYIVDHPTTAILIVEVSDATLEEDTHDKADLYAAAGVLDYWVIDVTGRVLVFREPKPATTGRFGHTYGRVTAHGRDEEITPLARPEARVSVSELLP